MRQSCKQCSVEKELSEFYSHLEWKNWVLWRCKECIKEGRKSNKEREMARAVDRNRVRPEWYTYEATKKYREKFPEKQKAHSVVNNYYRSNEKPSKCVSCESDDKRLHMHHEDYNKPREIIPLCNSCHTLRHKWKLDIQKEWIITFK